MNSESLKPAAAILLCGHGSRHADAGPDFPHLVTKVQQKLALQTVTGAFLEFQDPTIEAALQQLYDRGHRDIIVQPVTLYNAGHTKNDIPEILKKFHASHPDLHLRYGQALGLIPPVIDAASLVLETTLQAIQPGVNPGDCKLLVVGRGSRDRLVADQTITLCRKLHTRFEFGDSGYCYAFTSAPLLKSALAQVARSHYHHVIVLPFLLFPGRLLSDIYGEVDKAAATHPGFRFHKAPALGPQDFLVEAIMDRIDHCRQLN
ncbi:MAG: sirohydrochlorin chelatase [Rhodobacteraceae bacterium]|nr:sirohydrochlorin chelatase [Paracoccaceae bacterium]